MNNLEFSRLLTNLKIVSEIRFHPNESVGKDNLKITKACRLE